jgi:hypothetical protein
MNSLWGSIPDPSSIATPIRILKEQASILSDMTEGTLRGEVILVKNPDPSYDLDYWGSITSDNVPYYLELNALP